MNIYALLLSLTSPIRAAYLATTVSFTVPIHRNSSVRSIADGLKNQMAWSLQVSPEATKGFTSAENQMTRLGRIVCRLP